MGNCLFLCARGWGIGRQVHKCPGVYPGEMVTGRIEPRIIVFAVTLTDVHEHLYRYGGFPPSVDVKMGLLGIHPKAQLQGRYSTK